MFIIGCVMTMFVNMPLFDGSSNSKSLVPYPGAICTRAWTEMILMPVFNEAIFTAVGYDGSQLFSFFLPRAWDKSRPKVCVIALFCAVKAYVKCTVGSEKVILRFKPMLNNCMHTSLCLDFTSVCFQSNLDWFLLIYKP